MLTEARAWDVLQQVLDPEIPVISVCELGIVRELRAEQDCMVVVITPTYSGCPATEVIESAIRDALEQAGAAAIRIETRLSPAWTTDWITSAGAAKLQAHGIAPPQPTAPHTQLLHFVPPEPACPRCGVKQAERLSEFGSTACKALYRCRSCQEPFEYFKSI